MIFSLPTRCLRMNLLQFVIGWSQYFPLSRLIKKIAAWHRKVYVKELGWQ